MNRLIRLGFLVMAASVFATYVSADTTTVQNVKKDAAAVVSEDILVDDTDKDLLDLTKTPPADTVKSSVKNAVDASAGAKVDTVKKVVPEPAVPAAAKVTDEELILEGGAEDLLGGVKTEKPGDTASAAAAVSPNAQAVKSADSSRAVFAVKKDSAVVVKPQPKAAEVVPAKVEAASSINFARNLKDYRNPKIAMLLSLILPGTGEVYAKNYVRAGIFGALEIGVIATAIAYNVRGGNMTDDAHNYADQHYSSSDFLAYYTKLKNNFSNNGVADSIFARYYYSDVKPDEFSSSSKDYYELIGDEAGPYINGWDDVVPELSSNYEISDTAYGRYTVGTDSLYDSSYLIVRESDSLVAYGFSEHQGVYNDKVSKANKQYKISKNIFTLLIVNHVLSAIDAGICAKAYNDKLLGKQSLWQRINIRDITVASGSGIAPGYALEVRF